MRSEHRAHTAGFVLAAAMGVGSTVAACGVPAGDDVARRGGSEESLVACLQPGVTCTDRDFRGLDLSGRDLSGATLSGSRFDGANVAGAKFTNAKLQGTTWTPGACRIPMPEACLQGWGWNTLGEPVRIGPSTTIGSGTAGSADGDEPGEAQFSRPLAVAVSADDSTVYFADAGSRKIRTIDLKSGSTRTLAGAGSPCSMGPAQCGSGGPAMSVALSEPAGLALDDAGRRLFVSDAQSHLVWALNLDDRTMTIIAGDGQPGRPAAGEGTPAHGARLSNPRGLAFAGSKLFIADSSNNAVEAIDFSVDPENPVIRRLAGSPTGEACPGLTSHPCGLDGPASAALLRQPKGIAVAPDGSLLIADTGDHAIRRIGADGILTTPVSPDESASASGTFEPSFVAITSYGDAFVGPFGADQSLVGRLPADSLDGGSHGWQDVPVVSRVGQSNAGAAVAHSAKFAVVTRPDANQVQLLTAQVGANLGRADFTNADFGFYPPKAQSTVLDSVWQQGADFSGSTLDYAVIAGSAFDHLTKVQMQQSVVRDSTIGQVTDSDLGWSNLGLANAPASISGSCLANTRLITGAAEKWTITNSNLSGLRAYAPDPRTSLNDWRLDNVNMANTSADGRWTFKGGRLSKVNFSPSTNSGQVVFEGTSLTNVPKQKITKDSNRPDYSRTPSDWDAALTDSTCQPKRDAPPAATGVVARAATGEIRYSPGDAEASNSIRFELELRANDSGAPNSGAITARMTRSEIGTTAGDRPFSYVVRLDSGEAVALGRIGGYSNTDVLKDGEAVDITQSLRSIAPRLESRLTAGSQITFEVLGTSSWRFDREEFQGENPPLRSLATVTGAVTSS